MALLILFDLDCRCKTFADLGAEPYSILLDPTLTSTPVAPLRTTYYHSLNVTSPAFPLSLFRAAYTLTRVPAHRDS